MITAGSCCASGSITVGRIWFRTCSTAMSTAAFNSFFLMISIGPAPAAVTGFVSIATSVIMVVVTSAMHLIFNASTAPAAMSAPTGTGPRMSSSRCRFCERLTFHALTKAGPA